MKQNYRLSILAGVAMAFIAILLSTLFFNVSAEESNTGESNAEESKAEGANLNDWTVMRDITVAIEFDTITGCPLSVNPPDFFVRKARSVSWQSVDEQEIVKPESYTIFFGPFKDMSIKSSASGLATSTTLNSAPRTKSGVEYKYSIVGDRCPNTPLDPRFRLR